MLEQDPPPPPQKKKKKKNRNPNHPPGSLLHSRFQSRHATFLPTLWGGTFRDDTKNCCVADYPPAPFPGLTSCEN